MKTFTALATAIAVLAGSTLAQAASPTDAKADPIAQKFASLDLDKSGFLDGRELDMFKDKQTFLDMNKDGKVSSNEYHVGVMSGLISN